jgi:DNA-binding transcriptional ArsR family regulator
LRALLPDAGYFPDFLNPIAATLGLNDGLEAIRSTSKSRLRQDVTQLASTRRLPTGAASIANGSQRDLSDLTDTMQICYDLLVRPYEQDIEAAFERDRRCRLAALADGGVHGLLESLSPFACWTAGELCVPNHRSQNLQLRNRGLLLIPASFCVSTPVTLFDSELTPVLIYPATPHFTSAQQDDSGTAQSLVSLVGASRAAILRAVGKQRRVMSTPLARQLDISMASTSEHTKILRDAGLITSHREQNRLFHQLTPLGQELLMKSQRPRSTTENRSASRTA